MRALILVIKKELSASPVSFRFAAGMVASMLLFSVTTYVLAANYEAKRRTYQRSIK